MTRLARRTRPDLPAPVVAARPEDVAELGQLRRRELEVLSDRLGRVGVPEPGSRWSNAGVVSVSVALGGLVAGIPLLNSRSEWDSWVIPVYAGIVAVLLLVAGLCALAGRSVHEQHAESVAAIKTDLDRLLSAYEMTALGETTRDVTLHFVQRIRTEARDNRRLIQQASDHGRYWKVIESAPSTKEWKNNAIMLDDDPALSVAHDKGRQAAAEVERVLTARSFRMFRGGKVRADDRLGDALKALDDFDEALEDIMTSESSPTARARE